MFNGAIDNKEEILKGYEEVIKELVETKELDDKIAKLEKESEEVLDMINKCVHDNAITAQEQVEYVG